ncbi:MAG TPA: TolC family protein [Gemmatimonadaceae bacterium]|jgi:outer membrane protein TolC|nr:TolC family protein [Gemmatimonadaceae bacterium]
MSPLHDTRVRAALTLAVLALCAAPLAAQGQADGPRQLSLEDAIRTAVQQSAVMGIARAGVDRATGQYDQVRSQFLPQVSAMAQYTRTLRSQFSGFSFGGGPDTAATTSESLCAPHIDAGATAAERNAALAQAITCQSSSGGASSFQRVGFGAENQYVFGLQLSQNVFTWGKLTGQRTAATAQRNVADIELTAQRAQLVLDVTQAYYDAVLAQQLATIADSALTQTEDLLRQTQTARQVGNASEFDLLKAQVTRDNQRPQLLQAQTNRDVALLNLKRLLELPLTDSLELTTSIEEAPPPPLTGIATASAPDTVAAHRSSVREAVLNLQAQQGLLRAARADRFPAISLTSGYQRLYFPQNTFPSWSDYRENWTVGLSAQVSLFNGGRTHGSELIAQSGVDEARARLDQTRRYASLDSRVALRQLEQAQAEWQASAGTQEQAQRAYAIDQVRYRQGISTQTDLAQSRLLLQQAAANRAQAARDLAVARVRMALLRDLPLQQASPGGVASPAMSSASASANPQQNAAAQQGTTQAVSGTTGRIGGNTP